MNEDIKKKLERLNYVNDTITEMWLELSSWYQERFELEWKISRMRIDILNDG